jgi:hypothetical protein
MPGRGHFAAAVLTGTKGTRKEQVPSFPVFEIPPAEPAGKEKFQRAKHAMTGLKLGKNNLINKNSLNPFKYPSSTKTFLTYHLPLCMCSLLL